MSLTCQPACQHCLWRQHNSGKPWKEIRGVPKKNCTTTHIWVDVRYFLWGASPRVIIPMQSNPRTGGYFGHHLWAKVCSRCKKKTPKRKVGPFGGGSRVPKWHYWLILGNKNFHPALQAAAKICQNQNQPKNLSPTYPHTFKNPGVRSHRCQVNPLL